MTYAAHRKDFAPYAGHQAPAKRRAVARKSGFLRRFLDALHASRQRQADREIAAFLGRSGGHLTDDLERQMMQRISTSNWTVRD